MRDLTLSRRLVGVRPIPSGRCVQLGYVVIDIVFVVADTLLVFYFRFVPDCFYRLVRGELPEFPRSPSADAYLGLLFLYTLLIALFTNDQDLYSTPRTRTALDESLAVCKAVGLATLMLIVFVYLAGVTTVSRLVLGFSSMLNVATLTGWRLWKRQTVLRRVAAGYGARNVLIVGAGKAGQDVAHFLDANKHLGLVVKGFLDEKPSTDRRLLGRLEDLSQVARSQFVDEIIITAPLERELVKAVVLEARRNRMNVKLVPELYDGLSGSASVECLGDLPVMALHREPIPVLGLAIKRALDISLSLGGLVLVLPLLMAVAVAIKLDSHGPVFYSSLRVGKKGRRFNCYKFRTMLAHADAIKDQLRHLNERRGPFFKIADDPRLTRMGKFLRRYSLDELPQLWNVLTGEMSLVGPRPHPTDDFEQYTPEHLRRLDVTPGITGPWQVTARCDPSFEKSVALDLSYIENWNPWLDIKILLRTVPAILKGCGQ